jgi:hypothetical protein
MIRVVLFSGLALAALAHAEVRTFPACAPTLQQCLDAAQAGDTVRLTANLPAAETLVAKRSLTLEGAPGSMPRLAFGTTLTVTPEGNAPTEITVRNLELRGGWIDVTHERPADLTVTITGNRFVHGGPKPIIRVSEPVKVPTAPYGALTATMADNVLVADAADASNGILVYAEYATRMTVAVLRNVLEVSGSNQWGVRVEARTDTADLDVIGNRIGGVAHETGVMVNQRGGTLRARVVGNVVGGQDRAASAALSVATFAGAGDVLVANNTVANNRAGLVVWGDPNAALQGLVANNLVVGSLEVGLAVGRSVANRNNLIFANGYDAFDPGPGTLLADPRFAPGTLELAADSPARDAGATDAVPADVTADAAGKPRIAGKAVDIGAFERPCPECEPVAPPAACDDGDPCTEDRIDGGVCVHVPLDGIGAVACTCARPLAAACVGQAEPRGVQRTRARACGLVGGAASRAAVKRAARQWSVALRRARSRATRRRVGADCAAALAAGLGDSVARARAFLAGR